MEQKSNPILKVDYKLCHNNFKISLFLLSKHALVLNNSRVFVTAKEPSRNYVVSVGGRER